MTGAILVLIMQPLWCEWAWAFADQAQLVGVSVLIYCDEPHGDGDDDGDDDGDGGGLVERRWQWRWRWHDYGWAQGPWHTKDEDHAVDFSTLQRILKRIPAIRREQRDEAGATTDSAREDDLASGSVALGTVHAVESSSLHSCRSV